MPTLEDGAIVSYDGQPIVLELENHLNPDTGRWESDGTYNGYTLSDWRYEQAPTFEGIAPDLDLPLLGDAHAGPDPDALVSACAYCGELVENVPPPVVEDDAAWNQLATFHTGDPAGSTAGCEWIETRAHRLPLAPR